MRRFLLVALFLCIVSGDVGGYFLESDPQRRSDSSTSTPLMQALPRLGVGNNLDHPDRLPTGRIMQAQEAKGSGKSAKKTGAKKPKAKKPKAKKPKAKKPDAKVEKEKAEKEKAEKEKAEKEKAEKEKVEKEKVEKEKKTDKKSVKTDSKEKEEESKETEKDEKKETEEKEKETDKKSKAVPPVVVVNNLFRPLANSSEASSAFPADELEWEDEYEDEDEDDAEPSWASNNKPLIGCAVAGVSIIFLLFGFKVMSRCRRTTKPMAYKDLRNDEEFFNQEDDEGCEDGLYRTTYAHNDDEDSDRGVVYSSQRSLKQRNLGSVLDLEDEPQDEEEGQEDTHGGRQQNSEASSEFFKPPSSGDPNYLSAFR